ncbi:hypothetical protein DLAC_02669 [Tieghemostelium lacteum]|uniref:SAC domain-containing protein n=1 Tax=Tieghemostelium lacteum TaxID=361077 RepID=A0A152A351_TIELA|nr:hypothetical protein DLAC_02669 [Tieghemostelium lacteum]|eukprot:KYR00640.1 hypothetical protein DLAC_02669 [Tieghemostelium lacteum]
MDTHLNFNSSTNTPSFGVKSNGSTTLQQQQINNSSNNNKFTIHDIYETTHGDVFILSTLSTRKDTQIIRIEGRCGMLLFEGLQGVDLFPNHRAATAYLQKKYTLKSKLRAFAILGYIITEKSSHLLVATKIRNEGDLMGIHTVNTIVEHQWIKIDLSYLNSYQSNENQQTEGSWTTTLLDESEMDSLSSKLSKESSGDMKSILKELQTFPFECTHYYCETYDLTNYFPSNQTTPFQYCSEFTWNEWLRKPFENSNLSHLCIVLLQGFISIKPIQSLNISISYIMKRSKLNPGTHLYAPGINENAGPANEYECEMIMWKNQSPSSLQSSQTSTPIINQPQQQQQQQQPQQQNGMSSSISLQNILNANGNSGNSGNSSNTGNTIEWTSHLWRRGTIPLWWRAMFKNQGSNEIELFLKDKGKENPNPFENTEIYYNNLLNRYKRFYESNKDSIPTIHLVNLLRTLESDRQENALTQLYLQSCDTAMSLLNCNLNIISFDWSNNLKSNNNLSKTVQMLWESSKYSMDSCSYSYGTVKIVNGLEEQPVLSPSHSTFSPPTLQQQTSIMSLLSSPMLLQPNSIGNPLKKSTSITQNLNDSTDKNPLSDSNGSSASGGHNQLGSPSSSSNSMVSPNNSSNSTNSDKRLVHLQYQPQREIMRYSCLDSLERVNIATFFNCFQILAMMGSKLGIGFHDLLGFGQISLEFMINTFKKLGLFSALSEFFLTSTDVCSILYTNNPAQPPPTIREFINITSVSSSLSNHLLTSQRKYQSLHSDENRNYQYLLILGVGGGTKFFPFNSSNGKEVSPYWISSPPSSCVMSLPTLLEGATLSPSILVRDIDDFCWIFPQNLNTCEVTIFLGQPSIVTELCLTISHGTNTDTYPQSMDVLLGNYYNEMHYVLQDILIPRCTTGTKLSYLLPKVPWESYNTSLNNFNNIPMDRYFNRYVKLIFYGSVTPITIGKMEIFGYNSNSFHSNSVQLIINPTYRNSLDRYQRKKEGTSPSGTMNASTLVNGQGSISDYTPILNHRESTRKEQISSESQSSRNDKIYRTLVNDQIDSILAILNQDDKDINEIDDDLQLIENIEKLNSDSSIANSPSSAYGTSPNQETSKLKKLSDIDEILLISDYNGDNSSNSNSSNNSNNNYSSNNNNNSNNNHSSIVKEDISETLIINTNNANDPPLKQYEFYLKRLLNLNKEGKIISLLEALELECKRIQLKVSPWERDNLTKSLGISNNLLNPDRFIFERDEKIESSIRKNNKYKSSICQRPQCGKPLAFLDKIRHLQCNYCYKRFCPSCVSSNQVKVLEFESQKLISVCNNCSVLIQKQESLLERITNHNRHYHIERSKQQLSFYQKVLMNSSHNQNNVNFNSNNITSIPLNFESLSKTLIPLAEYPKGAILRSIPTDILSPPIETVLLPPGVLPLNMYWYAPRDVNSVELVIILSCESLAFSISLIADSLGYHNYDLPQVEVRVSKTFTKHPDQFETLEPWIFHPNGWSTTDPNLVIQPQSCVSYILPQPIQARAISLKFTLPDLPEFLKYDDNSGPPITPFLHIGRIAVHGTFSDTLVDIPTFTFSSIPLEPAHKELYENTLYTNSLIAQKRNPIKTSLTVKSQKTIHLTLSNTNTNIKGFSLIIATDENEGVKSQIKGLSLSCITVNQKGETLSHQFITQILVPKSRLNSTLYYDLPNLPPMIQTLVFEFTSNYGGKITTFPKVLIY